MREFADELRHLDRMRQEVKQYLGDTQTLPGLIDVLDGCIHALFYCPRDLIERMHEELVVMKKIDGMSRDGGLLEALPRDQRMLQEAVSAMERLSDMAYSVVEAKEARRPPR